MCLTYLEPTEFKYNKAGKLRRAGTWKGPTNILSSGKF